VVDSWREFEPEVLALFERGIGPRLVGDETFEDAMSLGFAMGAERAHNLQRQITPFDVELVTAGLCWWPLKPAPSAASEQHARQVRTALLQRAHQFGYLGRRPDDERLPVPQDGIDEPDLQLITTLLTAPTDQVIELLINRAEPTGQAFA
jgi:hypothetical protein